MNLFEQQALALRRIPQPDALAGALRFIEAASLEHCGAVAQQLGARLSALEQTRGGMQAACLDEAAQFLADAAADIRGALDAGQDAPCACGRCDGCVAARSDEHHDRRRDGSMG